MRFNFSVDDKLKVRILFFSLFLVLIYFLKSLLLPFIIGGILAYLTYPLYEKTRNVFKFRGLSSFIVVIETILIVILPIIYLVFELIYSIFEIYQTYFLKDTTLSIQLKNKLIEFTYLLVPFDPIRDNIIKTFNNLLISIFNKIYLFLINFTLSLPSLILYLIIVALSQYYLLIYGRKIVEFLRENMPFGKYNHIIIKNFVKTVDSIIFGTFLPPLVQSLSLVLILFLLGVRENLVLIGFIGFIFALIPSVGIWVVWIPLSIKIWLESTTKLLIYFIYNLIVTSNIDFFTRLLIAHRIASVPIWLVLFTSLGGLLSYGFLGMIFSLFVGTFLYNLYIDIKKEEKT